METAIRSGRRGGCRLEAEMLPLPSYSGTKPTVVIHNYGHGPKGVMLHWGCAQDIVAISKEFLIGAKL